MQGFDWNGNGKKDTFDHYMDMKVSSNSDNQSNSTGNNRRFGLGWVAIVVVAIMLIYFIAEGATWDAIDRLLGFGLIAFLFLRWISR